jgi:adenylate cyclase
MGEDELGTVRTLEAYREMIAEVIRNCSGRVVDAPGDNVLAEFASVVDAVESAVEIQNELKAKNAELPENRRMEFRIGINLGDVIEEGERIYGDGVNVAARIEGLAEGGGICISRTAFDQVKNKLNLGFENLGEHSVKNIAEPVRVYRLLMDAEAAGKVIGEVRPKTKQLRGVAIGAVAVLIIVAGVLAIWNFYFRPAFEPASMGKMAFPLPDKPSIAVLPFVNMSGDLEQEYFSDGLTEEIITALSKIRHLFVVARNSTFVYKGKPINIKQVAEDLGVGYVLEGSVRKSGDQIRITAQLIDAIKGSHLWAERYDLEMKDVFALQDNITKKVITELQVTLTEGEQARLWEKGTNNADAYLKFLQGLNQGEKRSVEGNIRAIQLFEEAIALDPQYSVAYAWLGNSHIDSIRFGRDVSRKEAVKKAFELAKKAVAMDESNADCYFVLGRVYRYKKNHEKALAHIDRALALNPNHVNANFLKGAELKTLGRYEEAISHFKRAYRVNPFYKPIFGMLGSAYVIMGKYEEAIHHFEKLNLLKGPNVNPLIWLTQAYMGVGREDAARETVEKILVINPDMTVDRFKKMNAHFYQDAAILEVHAELLRKAGLPEKPHLQLPDKPSIAVLPFVNMSGDPKQAYFSDGLTEQIITSLSKVSDLFVIARTSSFRYKGKEVNVQLVGRELGVRHILEGSVQRSGDRVRINAQLIDAKTGHHLWAERYDRNLKDIFALQDDITKQILTALNAKLTYGEDSRVHSKSTNNLEAYLKLLEGHKHLMLHNENANLLARKLFKEAISLDPNYAAAYQNLSWTYLFDASYGWTKARDKSLEAAYEFARKTLALDDTQAHAYAALSSYHLQRGKISEAVALREKAVALEPSSANYRALLGIALLFMRGRTEEATKELKIANRLDPFPPNWILHYLGAAYRVNGEYGKAIETFKKVIKRNPDYWLSHLGLAACYGLQGREKEAKVAAAEVVRIRPKFSLAKVMAPYRDKADKERTLKLLREAGLK